MTGTERKVFQKYYPPDFDPSKIPRAKGQRNKQFVQRVMTPFNMQCNTCHEYIYKGKKFNMKRETAEGETYLGLKIFRFYFRCPNCLAEITFKTDLENCDYQNEHGATRLFEAVKLYQDQQKQVEEKEAEDAKDPMKMLEKRTMMSRQEMEEMGNLEDLQDLSRHKEGIDTLGYLSATDPHAAQAFRIKMQEDEDDRLAREMLGIAEDGKFAKRIKDEEEEDEDYDYNKPGPSTSSMKREIKLEVKKEEPEEEEKKIEEPPKKKKPDQKDILSKMIVLKKKPEKIEVTPPVSTTIGGLAGLADYGSGSDSD
ncbi:unnamed protein product [Caenorhabditis angaria]|uniref:Splicing factor YJU2 n=1 Tax=Caenorhabditis angaria TaxID=860376 RepID=A0A9P1IKF2_9PELO|nr:unnamed protein product [Caenorhabditis angaria]